MIRSYQILFFLVLAVAFVQSQEKCEKVGPICSKDETKVQLCLEVGKDPTEMETCKEGTKCKDKNGDVACEDPSKAELKMKCTGKGEFPDPKDCSRTYICKDGQDEPAEVCNCPGGSFVYPEQGLYCVPDECPRKPITCTEGASGYFEWKEGDQKTSYYYYCVKSDVVEVYEGVEVPANARSFRRGLLREMKNGKECKPFEGSTSTTQPPKTTETTAKPAEATPKPTTKPTEATTKPTEATTKPTEPTTKPTEPTTKPTEPTTKPTEPTTKPTEATTKPTEPTTKPTEATTKPTEPSTKPTEATTKPTEPTTKPTEPTTKPTEPTTKPTEPTTKPTEPTTKPTTPKPDDKPKCSKERQRFPTECDCDYFECDAKLEPKRRICRNGMIYYHKFEKCIYGECDPSKCTGRGK